MKPNKDCVETIFNFVVANTSFPDGDIEHIKDFNYDIFCPKSDVLLTDIEKECSNFSLDEIKTAIWLLKTNKILSSTSNKEGKVKGLSLTPLGYSKILSDLFNPLFDK